MTEHERCLPARKRLEYSDMTAPSRRSRHDEDVTLSRIRTMCRQENAVYSLRRYDFLPPTYELDKVPSDLTEEPVDIDCRTKMCDWCFSVAKHCNFSTESSVIAISHLDRFICTEQGSKVLKSRREFQLACMASVYLVIKTNEKKILSAAAMARISRGDYSEDEIIAMEMDILDALNWRVNPPTTLSFIREYLDFLRPPSSIYGKVTTYANAQVELAVREYDLIGVKASVLAYAAVLNAISFFGDANNYPAKKRLEIVADICRSSSDLFQLREDLLRVDAEEEIRELMAQECGLSRGEMISSPSASKPGASPTSRSVFEEARRIGGLFCGILEPFLMKGLDCYVQH